MGCLHRPLKIEFFRILRNGENGFVCLIFGDESLIESDEERYLIVNAVRGRGRRRRRG